MVGLGASDSEKYVNPSWNSTRFFERPLPSIGGDEDEGAASLSGDLRGSLRRRIEKLLPCTGIITHIAANMPKRKAGKGLPSSSDQQYVFVFILFYLF